MKHSLLKQRIDEIEQKIWNCSECKELFDLRQKKLHNCPVLGFNFNHYLNAKVLSLCEAPGIYKPEKGEIFIDKLEDFHKIYDKRIQTEAKIGKRLLYIFSKLNLTWNDIQHFNVVCCSPPNYRTPTIDERESCLHFLKERIDLLQRVKVIVAFGSVAKQAIKQIKVKIPIVGSYHPSRLWYMSEEEREEYIGNLTKQISCYLT